MENIFFKWRKDLSITTFLLPWVIPVPSTNYSLLRFVNELTELYPSREKRIVNFYAIVLNNIIEWSS
jgi:hypothetical protein